MASHTTLPVVVLFSLTTYSLYLCYENITRLQQYEKQSEKAAKWSNTVASRLHDTRTTQASGTITLLVSFFTALYTFFTSTSRYFFTFAAVLNCITLILAQRHMAAFWNNKNQVQVPFVEKFNEAIKGSEMVVKLLRPLSFAWLWAAFLCFFGPRTALLSNAIYVFGMGLGWLVYFQPTSEAVDKSA